MAAPSTKTPTQRQSRRTGHARLRRPHGLGAAFKWTLQESSPVPKELLSSFPLCEEEPQPVPW